ncbi:hypothetical protein [Nocardioides sp. L-11A]|uniref:hypothetical protein n=1 Tax=Nocardioides sp. L-11A TaxID=3043848 RepID=UPI00249BF085|nr:hypothetical protein QJ852_17040 [Nocardioides sp. L-11A]
MATVALSLAATQAPASSARGPASPSRVAAAANPSDPFVIPSFFTGDTILESPEQLRTGGVNCAAPGVPEASNAGDGSGHGYRLPFRIALTDGRVLGGYSQRAAEAGKYPWKAGGFGLTGWVAGWVEIPSMEFDIPADGVVLCPGGRGFWHGVSTSATDPVPVGQFNSMVAYPGSATDMEIELSPRGAVTAALTGLAENGALEMAASLPVEAAFAIVGLEGDRTNVCSAATEIALGTDPGRVPASFAPVQSNLSPDPADWRPGTFGRYYTPEYAFAATLPTRDYLPTRGLAAAVEGGRATVGSVTMTWPGSIGGGLCSSPYIYSGQLAPLDPATALTPPTLDIYGAYLPTRPFPGYDTPPGAIQAGIDLTVDTVGLRHGVPDGFGFDG